MAGVPDRVETSFRDTCFYRYCGWICGEAMKKRHKIDLIFWLIVTLGSAFGYLWFILGG